MRTPVAITALLALVAVAGCNRLQPKKPTLDVRGVAIGSVSFSGITGSLTVEVTNPNDFGVPLAAVDWQLSVGGARAVTGSVTLSNTIPANGSTTVEISLSIAALDAVHVARKLSAGQRNYQIDGVMHFNAPIGRIDVSFSGSGDLGTLVSAR